MGFSTPVNLFYEIEMLLHKIVEVLHVFEKEIAWSFSTFVTHASQLQEMKRQKRNSALLCDSPGVSMHEFT